VAVTTTTKMLYYVAAIFFERGNSLHLLRSALQIAYITHIIYKRRHEWSEKIVTIRLMEHQRISVWYGGGSVFD
jgi:hypothetical protein